MNGYDEMMTLNKPFALGEIGPPQPNGQYDFAQWCVFFFQFDLKYCRDCFLGSMQLKVDFLVLFISLLGTMLGLRQRISMLTLT